MYLWISIVSGILLVLGGYQAMKNTEKKNNENKRLRTELLDLKNNGENIIVSQTSIKQIQAGIKTNIDKIELLQTSMDAFMRKTAQIESNYKASRLEDSKNSFNLTFAVLRSWIDKIISYNDSITERDDKELIRNDIKRINELFLKLNTNIYLSENPELYKKVMELYDYVDSAMRQITFYDDIGASLMELKRKYFQWDAGYEHLLENFRRINYQKLSKKRNH
jgi:hypothetical protein